MERILSLLGLAHKAGRVEIGEEPVGSAARAKKARIILVAGDAAASSVRRAMGFANTGSCLCLVIPATRMILAFLARAAEPTGSSPISTRPAL